MEVLAANVRANPVIEGIRLPGLSYLLPVLSLYADNTSAVVSSDPAIIAVVETHASFE